MDHKGLKRHQVRQAPYKPNHAKPEGLPGHIPASVPLLGIDYNFTPQAIMQLQRSTGELTAAVGALAGQMEKQAVRIGNMDEKLSGVTHKIYAAGVVLTILVAVGGFLVSKAWDMMVWVAKPAVVEPSLAHTPSSLWPGAQK